MIIIEWYLNNAEWTVPVSLVILWTSMSVYRAARALERLAEM